MKDIALHLPINNLSFGQVSTLILRTLYEREATGTAKYNIFLFPIGNIDFSSQKTPELFKKWLQEKIINGLENHKRDTQAFKLWHLNGSLESISRYQTLLTFHELDEATKVEANIARNNITWFSSQYSCDVFKKAGVDTRCVPLGFDSYNFFPVNKKLHKDERITFNLCGKLEKRKHHEKVIQAWIKRFGNNPQYTLQCAIYNPFLQPEQNKQILGQILKTHKPFNVNFYPVMTENSVYNEFLNSADIIIGMSGGEGFGLPEFQSVALGKHAVILNAHAYKTWATKETVTLVEPSGMIPVYDNMFFAKGQPFNQGNIFDFNEDAFIAGCETAIKKVEATNRKNEAGLLLQSQFSKDKFVDSILETFI